MTRASGSRPIVGSWGHRQHKNFTETVRPKKNQKLFFLLLRSSVFDFSELGFSLMRICLLPLFPPSLFSSDSEFHSCPSLRDLFCSAKHWKIVAFPYSRATLRAMRSDRPDPVSVDFCWIWTIWLYGTMNCPTMGKRYYFPVFRWRLLRHPSGHFSTPSPKQTKNHPKWQSLEHTHIRNFGKKIGSEDSGVLVLRFERSETAWRFAVTNVFTFGDNWWTGDVFSKLSLYNE